MSWGPAGRLSWISTDQKSGRSSTAIDALRAELSRSLPSIERRSWWSGRRFMVELTTEQFEAARTRGEARLRGPRAESVYYDESRDRIIVRLSTGVELGLTPGAVEGLA